MPVEMKIEIEEGGEKLTVTDGTNKAFAYGDAEPQPARTDPTESLSRSLSKTGGTPFSAEKIDVEMDGALVRAGQCHQRVAPRRRWTPAEKRETCARGR